MLIAKRELNVASRGPFLSRYISFSTVISLSHTHSHTHTHKHPHTVRKILCYLSTQFSPLSLSLPYSLRFKTVSVGLEPLEDRPRRLRGLVLPHSLSPCHAFSQRDLSFFFFVRGSTTTEKRTALFVWRSIATRQLRDCNVGTRETFLRNPPWHFRLRVVFVSGYFPAYFFAIIDSRQSRLPVEGQPVRETSSNFLFQLGKVSSIVLSKSTPKGRLDSLPWR